jgi:hypothetical protein
MPHYFRKLAPLALCALGCAAFGARAVAGDPTYFRSDLGRASSATGSLPAILDGPGALRWRVPMDPGHSTPVRSGGKLFLTAYHAETRELAVLAVDEKSGKKRGDTLAPGGCCS